ncbi:MAG: hypothetical protein QXJ75_02745 [Candidatus Bathyarchaeia archaeon]
MYSYIKLSKATASYREAKSIVATLIESFNTRLKTQNLKIEEALKISHEASSLASSAYEHMKLGGENFTNMKSCVEYTLNVQNVIAKNLVAIKEYIVKLARRQDEFQEQVKSLDNRYRGLLPEVEKTAILPVEGEIFISKLTPTELHILECLAFEGPKPAPELKNLVGKTREHTARLMKKLFSEGYVERETGSIPYKYKINEKIRPIIEQRRKKVELDRPSDNTFDNTLQKV